MSAITTHVLDTARGCPAEGIDLRLERQEAAGWTSLASGTTNADGRVADLLGERPLTAGTYRMTFETASYFQATGTGGFYPYVAIVFHIVDPGQHYHVPLLLSPYGYSTYRGS